MQNLKCKSIRSHAVGSLEDVSSKAATIILLGKITTGMALVAEEIHSNAVLHSLLVLVSVVNKFLLVSVLSHAIIVLVPVL